MASVYYSPLQPGPSRYVLVHNLHSPDCLIWVFTMGNTSRGEGIGLAFQGFLRHYHLLSLLLSFLHCNKWVRLGWLDGWIGCMNSRFGGNERYQKNIIIPYGQMQNKFK